MALGHADPRGLNLGPVIRVASTLMPHVLSELFAAALVAMGLVIGALGLLDFLTFVGPALLAAVVVLGYDRHRRRRARG